MKISDYRRMSDGDSPLVQAVERFVVMEARKSCPTHGARAANTRYGRSRGIRLITVRTESEVVTARAWLAESFQRWHRYEFENTMLPLPLQSEMQQNQIVGSVSRSCRTHRTAVWWMERLARETINMESNDAAIYIKLIKSKPTIPQKYLGISFTPGPPTNHVPGKNCHPILEIRSLVGIERLFQHTRTPVSPVLFGCCRK
jgi:hypothetical protein